MSRSETRARTIANLLDEQHARVMLAGVRGPRTTTLDWPEGVVLRRGYSVLWAPLGEAVRAELQKEATMTTASPKHLLLVTNLKWVTIGPVRHYARALLVEPIDPEDFVGSRPEDSHACRVRGFSTNCFSPVFETTTAAFKHVLLAGGPHEEIRFGSGLVVELVRLLPARPLDVELFEDESYPRVWAALNSKVSQYGTLSESLEERLDRLLAQLSNSSRADDRNVALMLRSSVHPDDGRVYPKRGELFVGDEYAEHGRVRSQAIQRTIRRAHELGLSDDPKRFVPNALAESLAVYLVAKEIVAKDAQK